MNRIILFLSLITVLALVFWVTGVPLAEAYDDFPEPTIHPSDGYPNCCVNFDRLQGQNCANFTKVYCGWGYYGHGYCECYNNYWSCYSYQYIPPNHESLCYFNE
jgi:hypothetical protein